MTDENNNMRTAAEVDAELRDFIRDIGPGLLDVIDDVTDSKITALAVVAVSLNANGHVRTTTSFGGEAFYIVGGVAELQRKIDREF